MKDRRRKDLVRDLSRASWVTAHSATRTRRPPEIRSLWQQNRGIGPHQFSNLRSAEERRKEPVTNKLSDLTPDSVALEITDWVNAHLMSLCFAAGIVEPVVVPGGSLAHEVRELTHYAQTGEIDGSPQGRLQTVVDALYSTAHPDASSAVDPADATGKGEPTRAIDVVIRAALARQAIDDGERVPLSWLAALGGLSVASLRSYAARGELATVGPEVRAKDARRWLGARGVAGYR